MRTRSVAMESDVDTGRRNAGAFRGRSTERIDRKDQWEDYRLEAMCNPMLIMLSAKTPSPTQRFIP